MSWRDHAKLIVAIVLIVTALVILFSPCENQAQFNLMAMPGECK